MTVVLHDYRFAFKMIVLAIAQLQTLTEMFFFLQMITALILPDGSNGFRTATSPYELGRVLYTFLWVGSCCVRPNKSDRRPTQCRPTSFLLYRYRLPAIVE